MNRNQFSELMPVTLRSLQLHQGMRCFQALDNYHRCSICLVVYGRRPNDDWQPGDDRFVPGMLRPKDVN